MIETELIAEELQRAFESNAWHGPALLEALEGVDADIAQARGIDGAHTVWELVLHLTAWKEIVARRLEGEQIVEVSDAEDWPAGKVRDNNAWTSTLEALYRSHDRLLRALRAFDSNRLSENVPGKDYTFRTMVRGVAQHDDYHAGQVMLLKRAARTSAATGA